MPLQYPYNPEAMYIRIAHAEAIREEICAVCVRAMDSHGRGRAHNGGYNYESMDSRNAYYEVSRVPTGCNESLRYFRISFRRFSRSGNAAA